MYKHKIINKQCLKINIKQTSSNKDHTCIRFYKQIFPTEKNYEDVDKEIIVDNKNDKDEQENEVGNDSMISNDALLNYDENKAGLIVMLLVL